MAVYADVNSLAVAFSFCALVEDYTPVSFLALI